MIVIADKDRVFQDFPIPLINRLEKHYVVTSTFMSKHNKDGENMIKMVETLKDWAKDFAHVQSTK